MNLWFFSSSSISWNSLRRIGIIYMFDSFPCEDVHYRTSVAGDFFKFNLFISNFVFGSSLFSSWWAWLKIYQFCLFFQINNSCCHWYFLFVKSLFYLLSLWPLIIDINGMLKSTTIMMLLLISPFISVNI